MSTELWSLSLKLRVQVGLRTLEISKNSLTELPPFILEIPTLEVIEVSLIIKHNCVILGVQTSCRLRKIALLDAPAYLGQQMHV